MNHPLWLAGFRPFFLLAMISGALLPAVWGVGFSKGLPLAWHVHEMFYGFGWAVLGGFLLTSTKNWVGVRGIHGSTLIIMTGLWALDRLTFVSRGVVTELAFFVMANAFIVFINGYLLWTLIKFRKQDTYRDNFFFLLALPLFVVAKNLLLHEEYYIYGWTLTLGLFRLCFSVMFERTLTQFMKNSFQANLYRNKILDLGIHVLVLLSAFEAWWPAPVSAAFLALSGILLGVRFLLWKPLLGLSTFGIGLSYAGYLGLALHLAFQSFYYLGKLNVLGSVAIHVFTFLCMALVASAMMIRISQGHTGRKFQFTKSDKVGIGFLLFGALCRLVLTQVLSENYLTWIMLSGLSWSVCFLLLGWRLIPFLLKARIDGREH